MVYKSSSNTGGGGGGTVTSVSGTANRITSTGGNTPVIDISGSYVGQSSITTVGTLTTGTWAAGTVTATGTGSATAADASTQPATFTGGGSPTAGNLYGINIAKTGFENLMMGINKNSTTGEIPASGTYISTYTNNGTISIGRGNSAGGPSSADIAISTAGSVSVPRGLAVGLAAIITSNASSALTIGPNGATTPAFQVDASAGTLVNGVKITGQATGTAPIIEPIGDTNLAMTVRPRGAQSLNLDTASASGSVIMRNNGGTRFTVGNTTIAAVSTAMTSGSSVRYSWTGSADTALTASTDIPNAYFNFGQTRQHATGAITTQRDFRITPSTHSAVAASVISDAYGLYIDSAPAAGTNVTITNPWAVGMAGRLVVTNTDATVDIGSLARIAGSSYTGLDWSVTDTTGVRFAKVGYAAHSGNGSITSTGHLGGVLGYAQKTGTGTDELVIGLEGRVGSVTASGVITLAAAVTATFDTNGENAGTMTSAVGFYVPTQSDSGHITGSKYAFLNNNTDWELRTNGPSTLFGKITQDITIIPPATTGAQTIDKPMGKVNFAAGATSLVVTNSLCTANSIVLLNQQTLDAAMLTCNAIPDAGFFTIVAVGTPAAEVKVAFMVLN